MEHLHKFADRSEYESQITFTPNSIKQPSCTLIEDTDEVIYDTPALPLSIEDKKLIKPLTFDILTDGTISWKQYFTANKTIKYRKNDQDWVEITSSSAGTEISVQTGDVLQFKGNNSHYVGSSFYGRDNPNGAYFSGTASFNVSGNIMSLINENENIYYKLKSIVDTYCFPHLFYGSNVINAEDLLLPATKLRYGDYIGMFKNCSSLITAPILPATTLSNYCYQDMFSGCTSLTTAPALPATTMDRYCYEQMFYGCTSLAVAPELPAIELETSCYKSMFASTGLTTTPVLPATTLAYGCYELMFNSCQSLTSATELPAKNVYDSAYTSMFANCQNLITTPKMDGVNLGYYSCKQMFRNCIRLTSAGNIQINEVSPYSCQYMFETCYSLTTPPVLSATTLGNYCYQSMFINCLSLTTAPDLPATTLVTSCYSNMFTGCSSLNYIKCLATNPTGYTQYWVCKTSYTAGASSYNTYTNQVGVASTGTFVKADGVTWSTGSSGVPGTWTQQVYQE